MMMMTMMAIENSLLLLLTFITLSILVHNRTVEATWPALFPDPLDPVRRAWPLSQRGEYCTVQIRYGSTYCALLALYCSALHTHRVHTSQRGEYCTVQLYRSSTVAHTAHCSRFTVVHCTLHRVHTSLSEGKILHCTD